ncbi:MAG: hypothetical protein AAGA55_01300 [Planctomycetota bacterium]
MSDKNRDALLWNEPRPLSLFSGLMRMPWGAAIFAVSIMLVIGWLFWVSVPFSRGVVIGFKQDGSSPPNAYLSFRAERSDIGLANHNYPRVVILQNGRRSGFGVRGSRLTRAKPSLIIEVSSESSVDIRVEDENGQARGAAWRQNGGHAFQPDASLRGTMNDAEWQRFLGVLGRSDGIEEPRLSELLASAEAALRKNGLVDLAEAVAGRSAQARSFRWTGLAISLGAVLVLFVIAFRFVRSGGA